MSRTILAARLVIFVTFLDLFIQFPLVAPFARSLGASATMVGLIVGVYSATNLIGNLVAGVVLDRWGRKMPVLIGLVGAVFALGAYAVASSPEQLLAIRAIHGLATAVLTPGAFALIGDVAAADRRARAMGISGAIIAVAATAGPPLAGIGGDRFGAEYVFFAGAGLMLLAAAFFGWQASETGRVAATESAGADRGALAFTGVSGLESAPHTNGYRDLWLRPRLVTAYLAALSLTIGLGTLVTHLPLALAALGESASRRGLAFTIYAVVAMAVMAGPIARWSDRSGRYLPLASGLLTTGVGMAILALGLVGGGVILGMAVFGLGFGLLFPPATALVVEATAPGERGAAFGIFYAVYSFGVVLGSVMSGALHERAGMVMATPFLVGAAVAIAAAPAVLLVGRRLVAASAPA